MRGAWLPAPFADKPDSRGLNTEDPADIRQTAELAWDRFNKALRRIAR